MAGKSTLVGSGTLPPVYETVSLMRSPVSFRLAIVAAGIVLLGACGSSVPDDTTASLRATTTAAATTATTDATGTSTTAASSTSTTPTSEPSGGASGGAFCEEMSRIASFADDEFEELVFDDDELTPENFDALQKAVADITGTLKKAAAAAPAEIRSDMEYMASYFDKFNEGIAAAETPEEVFGALFALAMEAEEDGADEDRLDEVEDRIEDFVEQHCGFEMEMDD